MLIWCGSGPGIVVTSECYPSGSEASGVGSGGGEVRRPMVMLYERFADVEKLRKKTKIKNLFAQTTTQNESRTKVRQAIGVSISDFVNFEGHGGAPYRLFDGKIPNSLKQFRKPASLRGFHVDAPNEAANVPLQKSVFFFQRFQSKEKVLKLTARKEQLGFFVL
ncbi:hypothetical protein EVAR_43422_1 [Eumeta japonica]|uniref:Uncharacterized protein n=1 Tax=Eumeta variegata TaxID=151549 RepID=A0A4C1WUJ9_EUMVA|nr:hypothetical protein EVAR_43422_1 [Eumeta japonica]